MLSVVAVSLWGGRLLAERNLARASLSELASDAKRYPNNPRIFHYLGLRYQQAGDFSNALTAFSRAAQMDTADETSWLGWAAAAESLGRENDSYGILAGYLKLHRESAAAHYALAQIYGRRQVHKAAWEEASLAAQLNPHSADAWRLVGEEALLRGDAAGAETALQRAATLRPADWRNQLGLGNVAMAQDQNVAGVQCFDQAVRLAPEQATAHLCLGRALLARAHTPDAIEAARRSLQRAIELQPDLAPAYPLLGESYSRQHRWMEARAVLLRADQLTPNNADIVFALKNAYEHTGEHSLAERLAQRHAILRDFDLKRRALISHLAMAPDDIGARLEVARLCAAHDDYADARNYYRSALARAPHTAAIQRELLTFEVNYAHKGSSAQQSATPR